MRREGLNRLAYEYLPCNSGYNAVIEYYMFHFHNTTRQKGRNNAIEIFSNNPQPIIQETQEASKVLARLNPGQSYSASVPSAQPAGRLAQEQNPQLVQSPKPAEQSSQ